MRWQPALLVVCVSAFMACGRSTTSPTSARLGDTFTLAPGSDAAIDGEGLTLGFDRVVSDSRCPTGTVCISPGEGVVSIWLLKSSVRETRELKTTAGASSAAYGAYRVALTRLDPYPAVGAQIPAGTYRATLIVTR